MIKVAFQNRAIRKPLAELWINKWVRNLHRRTEKELITDHSRKGDLDLYLT
jgi:hypothetical protein